MKILQAWLLLERSCAYHIACQVKVYEDPLTVHNMMGPRLCS